MKTTLLNICILLLIVAASSCQNNKSNSEKKPEKRVHVQLQTSKGNVLLELYNETPQHRDNFISLVEEGVLDSLLFHRVIENFMIQGGDPDSKNAPAGVPLGNGGLDYRVFPEFHPDLFHKKGALAAARDGNPDRASSSTQFYIVQGKIFNDSTLTVAQERINSWLAEHFTKNDSTNKDLTYAFQKAMDDNNMELYHLYNDSIKALAAQYTNYEKYTIPETHRQVYKNLGGTPHLDQNYTVFGEVIQGIEVVDSIAAVKTGAYNRPIENIRILKIIIIK